MEKSRSEKLEYRKEWASKQFERYTQTRQHTKRTENTQRNIGEHLNIDAIIKAEGGRKSEAAVRGALNYCA
eukprot:14405440-Alexandrium_andersonii.AAC.1